MPESRPYFQNPSRIRASVKVLDSSGLGAMSRSSYEGIFIDSCLFTGERDFLNQFLFEKDMNI